MKRVRTEEALEIMKRVLLGQGMEYIAADLGITVSQVRYFLRKQNLEHREEQLELRKQVFGEQVDQAAKNVELRL